MAPVGPLRGRGPEVEALGEALDRVAAGRPALVLMEGEAGIGKTRLLDGALEEARARGMQVARGRAEELEQSRPFGLVAAALGCVRSSDDPRRAAIADLLASHAGDRGPVTVTSDPGLQFRAVDAFADLVEALALAGPLVVGLDDLQWADSSSVLTLGAAARRIAGLPVALLGCLRPLPHSGDLDRLTGLLEAGGGRRMLLAPLPAQAVHDLVADALAAEPGPALLAEAAGAGGNPLFVTELVGALLQEGMVRVAGGRAEVAQARMPPTLRLTILRRLGFLPDGTLQVLRSASVLGSGFSLTDLATVTGGSALELSVALADAIRGGVVDDDAETLAAAVRAYRPGTRPLELAGACEDAGAAFARQGKADRVRPLLEQALEIYERLDAGRDVARAEAVLRAAGLRRGRRRPRGRPQSGWLSLTPAERAVASLVADGLSNPQIGARLYISRRTVQSHLAHVFAKLDIASRAQLAAQVTRYRS